MAETFRAAIPWITKGEGASRAVNAFLKRHVKIADKLSVMASWWPKLDEQNGAALCLLCAQLNSVQGSK